jgi:Zn-dependent protease
MDSVSPPAPEADRLAQANRVIDVAPERPSGPPEPPRRDRSHDSFFRRRIAPIGAAVLAFLAKLKALLLFAGQFKLLVTAGSMAVSVAAYATLWGFWFALGFVVLLLIHEMGHVLELRRHGIKATAPMFIPFMGALITSRTLGDDAVAEAKVGLAGPITGTIGASLCLVIWQITGNEFWQALGFTGLFLNLFNLMPVVPLDGGRAMAAMSPWMWIVGFVGMVVLTVLFPNPVLIIIDVFAAMETWRRLGQLRAGDRSDPHADRDLLLGAAHTDPYYQVAPRDRVMIGTVYLLLVAVIVVGMHATHLHATL